MTTTQEILRDGVSPNPTLNSTLANAQSILALLAPFLPSPWIAVNTTVRWPANAKMEPVAGLDIPADARLNFNVLMQQEGRTVDFNVANMIPYVRNHGAHDAVVGCLDIAVPEWRENFDLTVKVDALPGIVPPAVVPDQPVAAMPDWDDPRAKGTLGVREGDLSPLGTPYTSPAGVKWVKAVSEESMFGYCWKRA